MASSSNTRRQFLGAMAIAPLAISTPAAASSSDLAAKLAAYAEADQRVRNHDRDVYGPVCRRLDATCATIPHMTVEWGPERWSTSDRMQVSEARYFLDPSHTVGVSAWQGAYHQACVALIAAADDRASKVKAIADGLGVSAIADRNDALDNLRHTALNEVIRCPVSTGQDLARKIAFITEHGQWEFDETREAVSADAGRIAEAS